MSNGIDYGMGLANIDVETGVRYGVIAHHVVGAAWYEDSEADYPEPEPRNEEDEEDEEDEGFCELEPIGFFYKEEGYEAYQSADSPDIFITKAPYFTYAAFCSPCAPGAGYLTDEGGVKAYCFSVAWFYDNEDGVPYDVYDVKTGRKIASRGDKPE